MEKIRVLIVDDVPQTRKDIIRLLYFEDDMEVVGEAGDGLDALQKIAELRPDVVLMDINMPQLDGISATERVSQLHPTVAVVIISIQGESEYLKKAMFAGARDYLVKPLGSEEMAGTIRSVYRQKSLKNTQVSETSQPALSAPQKERPPQTSSPVQVIPQPAPPQSEEKPLGLVTTVFCGKGGVGKTTIATNLAVTLAQNGKKKVALVDFDLQFGDIAVMLNLTDGKSVSELVREQASITAEVIENYMIRHFTGIDILPAPLFPQDAEYINAGHIETVLRLLKQSYDYIIVDTAAAFHDINLQILDMTEQILLVVTREISAIKNAKTSLNILDSLSFREKIRLVLNRADQDLGVETADLEKGLEIVVAHQIPGDERAVVSAINKGVPVVVSNASSEIAKSFKRLCERMVSGKRLTVQEKQPKTIINRIFSL